MSANLSAVPKLQFFDNNGNPLVGGKLYTYAAGTTTPLATYVDASAGTPNTNPIILDSRGEANVWLSATTYKFVLTDASDATIWTVDNISNSLSLSQILAASGSAASPPYTFASDTDTGMYLAAVGQLGLTVAGTPVLRATDTLMVLDTDLNITGSARRITGDFSNATIADRVMFQTSTPNADAVIGILPSGTATVSAFNAYNTSNPTNSSYAQLVAFSGDIRVNSDKHGSGSYLPLTFYTSGTERMRIDSSGNVGIGTSSPDAVLTLNKPSLASDIRFKVNNVLYGTIYASASDVTLNAVASIPLTFGTNNNERMRIDASGNVAIGLPGPFSDKLTVAAASGAVYVATNNGTVNMVSGISAGNVGLMGTTTNHDLLLYANNAERGRFTGTGLFQFNSGYGSVATAYGCRAWINFDGTSGSIGTGRGSGNVSSVTDNGTGDYTINFTTSMPDANYAVVGMAMGNTGTAEVIVTTPATVAWAVGSVRIGVRGGAGSLADAPYVCAAVFR